MLDESELEQGLWLCMYLGLTVLDGGIDQFGVFRLLCGGKNERGVGSSLSIRVLGYEQA